jgi:hypothetical protein
MCELPDPTREPGEAALVDDPEPLPKNPAMLHRPGFAPGMLGALLALCACASPTTTAPEPRPAPPPADVEARIESLEAAIARDEEAIKAMISDPARVPGLREDPELVAIAERLPRLQAELAALRPEVDLPGDAANPRGDTANPVDAPTPGEVPPPIAEPPDGP